MDFTLTVFKKLISAFLANEYSFVTVTDSQCKDLLDKNLKFIILRHDVELQFERAWEMAKVENDLGGVGTYYIRLLPNHYNREIVKKLYEFGNEIGYHYDDVAACHGNHKKAFERFNKNLSSLRTIAPVNTISMDGSPLSKYDNRDIWKKYDYKQLGIIAEPYFDIDFNDLYYITDTGRKWDGHLVNVRDKATKDNPLTNPEFLKLRYHSTQDIIDAVNAGTFPKKAMLNFHPQRWHDQALPWMKELLWQNTKNVAKYFLIKMRK